MEMLILFTQTIVLGAKKANQKNGKIANNYKSLNKKQSNKRNPKLRKHFDAYGGKQSKGKKKGHDYQNTGELGKKKKIGKLQGKNKIQVGGNKKGHDYQNTLDWINQCSLKEGKQQAVEIPGCGSSIFFLDHF